MSFTKNDESNEKYKCFKNIIGNQSESYFDNTKRHINVKIPLMYILTIYATISKDKFV